MHSLQDLKTLRSAANNEILGMSRSYTKLVDTRQLSPDWRHAFSTALGDLQKRFGQASNFADAKIQAYADRPDTKPETIDAETEYRTMLAALSPLKDLRHRLAVLGQGTSEFGGDPATFPAQGIVTTAQTGTAGRLNVRASASTTGKVLGQFEHGAGVTITGPSQAGFYPVAFGTSGGFASAQYITAVAAQPAPDAPLPLPPAGTLPPVIVPPGTPAVITTADTGAAGRLNVRASASSSGAVVGQFEHGQTVTITAALVAGFYPVQGIGTNGKGLSGFASSQYVTPRPGALTPPMPVPIAPQVIPSAPSAPQAATLPATPAPAAGPMNLGNGNPLTPAAIVPATNPAVTPSAASQSPLGALLAKLPTKNRNLYIAGGGLAVAAVIGGGIYAATRKTKK